MNFLRTCGASLILAGFLLFAHHASGEAPVDPRVHEAYLHFVGVWTGERSYLSNGVIHKAKVVVTITEDRKKRMRWDTRYGTKGDPDFDKVTRFITLLPGKRIVTVEQKDFPPADAYDAPDVDQFLATGFGELSITREMLVNGSLGLYRRTFKLSQDSLEDSYEKKDDRGNFLTLGVSSLVRQESGAVGTALPKVGSAGSR